jgi:hypothetical protein
LEDTETHAASDTLELPLRQLIDPPLSIVFGRCGCSYRSKPEPKPDLLKIDCNWQDGIKKSLEKKKPAEGWPK